MIAVGGLRPGMFVSRLDRPWVEVPIGLQGFLIRHQRDVESLTRYCTHVYVDTTQGISPEPRFIRKPSNLPPPSSDTYSILRLRQANYQETADLQDEMPRARESYARFSDGVEQIFESLRANGELDLATVGEGMRTMVDSVLRNPDACGWLVRFQTSDDDLYRHALGSGVWAATFGRHLGLGRKELDDLVLGCLLMDLGKTRVPQEVLRKPGPLVGDERATVENHVHLGLELLERGQEVALAVREIVAYHHERYDGTGYPSRLRGETIPIFARIAGLVDAYDALTNPRPYRPAMSPHGAVDKLYDARGQNYQRELVEQFIQAIGIYPSGTLVELTSGEVAVVVAMNGIRRLRPTVMLLLGPDKRPYADFRLVDLLKEALGPDGRALNIQRGLPVGAYGIRPEELYL